MRINFVIIALFIVEGLAFSPFSAFEGHPGLKQLTPITTVTNNNKQGTKFTVRMDVGQKETDETHLILDNLGIELLWDPSTNKDARVGLPGADGPHPQASSGALSLNVFSTPSFIDMFGTQKVRFEKPCWEVIWRKDQMCGAVICGFQLPAGAKRNANSATLPDGRLYLSFPIWTAQGLADKQDAKQEIEGRVKEYNEEKNDELRKMEETSNLFKKAMHYRNAVAAVEKIDFSGIRMMDHVPGKDGVLPIGDGLMMNTQGTMWRKGTDFFGKKHSLLGEAFLTPVVEKSKVEDAMEVLRP